jgi:2,3,4,5-tetrahydropyridine-2-carboxylate N-succinyltransferase
MTELQQLVTEAFTTRELVKSDPHRAAIFETIARLDRGIVRVAEHEAQEWRVNDWVKKAILLYFVVNEMREIECGPFIFDDKLPLKRNYRELGVRVVPPAVARFGSFMERGVVLMSNSYVNIGAYIGARSMIDSFALVGSCAQIGSDVHVSGGVGIGGVLEPPQAQPVIVEDGAFIGYGCTLVEGVRIGREAVLGANVTITASTHLIDVTGSEPVTHIGVVPERSVVIPGVRSKRFPAGEFSVPCNLIIGTRTSSTDLKTSLNSVLREFSIGA